MTRKCGDPWSPKSLSDRPGRKNIGKQEETRGKRKIKNVWTSTWKSAHGGKLWKHHNQVGTEI